MEKPDPEKPSCAMPFCKAMKFQESSSTSFHAFPGDPYALKRWMKFVNNSNLDPTKSYLCSKHFREDDFEERYLRSKRGRTLKKGAIPSILVLTGKPKGLRPGPIRSTPFGRHFNPMQPAKRFESDNKTSINNNISLRHYRFRLKNEDDEVVSSSLKSLTENNEEQPPTNSTNMTLTNSDPIQNGLSTSHENLLPDYEDFTQETLIKSIAKTRNHNCKLEWQIRQLRQDYDDIVKLVDNLKSENDIVLAKTAALRKIRLKKEKSLMLEYNEKFSKNFSPAQMMSIANENKKIEWTIDDSFQAIKLRYMSRKSFNFLQHHLNYPLPLTSALNNWPSKVDLFQGFSDAILNMLDLFGKSKSERDRLTVLLIDEIKVKSLYEYNPVTDSILGVHSKMQVVLARGLFGNWKQPVMFPFDKKLSKLDLEEIISSLAKINYTVVAVVLNWNGRNENLWKELNISPLQHYFVNRLTNQNIYVFASAPDLLLLLKNNFFDNNIEMEDGMIFQKDTLKKLIFDDLFLPFGNFKLNSSHLDVSEKSRDRVSLASQIFSQTNANILKNGKYPDIEAFGNFVETVNNWFDVMNSRNRDEKLISKSPYGTNLNEQNNFLDKMYSITELIANNNHSQDVKYFKEAVLISINSLKCLEANIKAKFNKPYNIFTYKLNSEELKTFVQMLNPRSEVMPTPLDVVDRSRRIFFQKNGVRAVRHNFERHDEENELLVSLEIVRRARVKCRFVNIFSHNIDTIDKIFESEKDGFTYVVQWTANKFKEIHSALVNVSSTDVEHTYNMQKPSTWWMQRADRLEEAFNEFHNRNMGLEKKSVTNHLIQMLCNKYPDIPDELIYTFIKQRNLIKIKSLNYRIGVITWNPVNKKNSSKNVNKKQQSDDINNCSTSNVKRIKLNNVHFDS